MNKFVVSILLISVVLVAGCSSQQQAAQQTQPSSQPTLSAATLPIPTIKEFNVTAKMFEFTPDTITVSKGDEVLINAVSTDVVHGFAINEYNIDETLNPGQPATIRFTANKEGTFTFYCSVYCGSGHRSMKGTLVVNP